MTGIIFSIVILRVGHRRHDDTYYTQRAPTTTWQVRKNTMTQSGITQTTAASTTTAAVAGSSNVDVYGTAMKANDDEFELHSFSTKVVV